MASNIGPRETNEPQPEPKPATPKRKSTRLNPSTILWNNLIGSQQETHCIPGNRLLINQVIM